MVVQHNMQAMNANRMLGVTTGKQSKSTEKLSSGYRINRAADDAAGLSISEKMRKQIRGLDQASSNAEDGISAVQTAEGALTEVHSMLQRMNELAVQAANGTNSVSDRDAIQDEIEQLNKEINRVAETTKFNETYLLKGGEGTKTINLMAHDAGLEGKLTDNGDGTATFVMDAPEIGSRVSRGGKEYTIGSTVDEVKNLIKEPDSGTVDVTIGDKTFKITENGDVLNEDGNKLYVETVYNAAAPETFSVGAILTTAAQYRQGLDTYINNNAVTVDNLKEYVSDGTTITIGTIKTVAMTDSNGDGIDDNDVSIISAAKAHQLAALDLLAANRIGDIEGNAKVTLADGVTELTPTNGDGTFKIALAKVNVANALSFSLHAGSDADMSNKIQVNIEVMNTAYLGITGLNVSDNFGMAATYAIDAIADALEKVSAQRSELGAIQNRLEHSIANLDNVVENTTSAESRIRDTDMAEEMVNFSKNNILAQAGQAMLAQANQANEGVLSLLQ